jgi:hypothetical protein
MATAAMNAPARTVQGVPPDSPDHFVALASPGVCLGGMLLFTITGVTLNHASEIAAAPMLRQQQASLPPPLARALAAQKAEGKHALTGTVAVWLADRFLIRTMADVAEWSDADVYVSLPRPGGDAWISIDRASGVSKFEKTDRGWISYLNDLHKGRNTGHGWQVFIDVVAVACLVFPSPARAAQTHAPSPRDMAVVTFVGAGADSGDAVSGSSIKRS